MRQWFMFLGVVLFFATLPQASAQVQEERDDYYQKWLDENVLYIISAEERSVFGRLSTDEERDQFIEQFWLRRDPDPETAVNEFREEHYRRIQYANERFHSGIDGWRTDRGMIYIKFGPPSENESYASGGHYNRPSYEGGGATSTFPFEIWRYRYLEGVGEDVEIEFVDSTMSGLYQIATSPWEKDALLYAGMAGATEAEQLGLTSKVDRVAPITSPMPGHSPTGFGYGRLKDQPFERLRFLTDLERPVKLSNPKLREFVQSEVRYDALPFQVRSDYLRLSEEEYLVPLTLMVQNRHLQYQGNGPMLSASLVLYGEVVSLAGQVVERFEKVVASKIPGNELKQEMSRPSIFQEQLKLPPGRYMARLAVEDEVSGNIGTDVHLVVVPRLEDGTLATSSLVPALRIEPLTESVSGQFVMGPGLVFPNPKAELKIGTELPLFFQVYNLAVDQSTGSPYLDVEYIVLGQEGEELSTTDEISDLVGPDISVAKILELGGLTAGEYRLKVQVRDSLNNAKVVTEMRFTVVG